MMKDYPVKVMKLTLDEFREKAAKWDMIQWALKTESEFVTQTDGKETFITVIDIHRLEQLYKERD